MAILGFLETTGQYSNFALRAIPAALASIGRPGALLVQLYNILLGSLPLGLVAGLALGVVVWIHLHGIIEDPRVIHMVPEFLAFAVVIEFAPVSAGLIIAGRTGASLGAELGSMRLTEQIDALEVLGQSPMYKLVGPRVMGAMITLPVLTIFIAFISIGTSFLAEMLGGSLSWTQYQNYSLRRLTLIRVLPATLKTTIFGYLVAVTGCFFGMTATGGTEGVGIAATRGVVVSIFMVMIANVLLVQMIATLF